MQNIQVALEGLGWQGYSHPLFPVTDLLLASLDTIVVKIFRDKTPVCSQDEILRYEKRSSLH